ASQRQPSSKKTQNPLVRDGNELVPNVAHVFTPDQHLYLFYEVYDPARAKAPTPAEGKEKGQELKNPVDLLTSIEFFSGKITTYETPLVEVRQLNAPERKAQVFQFDVPLAQLKTGLYTCQVNLIDDAGGTFTFPRLPILVREKTQSPAPATAAGSSPSGSGEK